MVRTRGIENGIANVNRLNGENIYTRLYQLVWEYHNYSKNMNPGGHSLFMRFEYFKTAYYIIKSNFVIGIGTGDIVEAYKQAYIDTNSKLAKRFQKRAHNQYLTFLLSFGIVGLIYFIFSIAYPLINYPNKNKV